jgi:hypothetical protein
VIIGTGASQGNIYAYAMVPGPAAVAAVRRRLRADMDIVLTQC